MSTDVTDAETTTALATTNPGNIMSGAGWALARLPDKEFEALMQSAIKGRSRIQQVMRGMMKLGTHYGPIPGGKQDHMVLFKPGAEVLRQMFRLVAVPKAEIRYGDGVTSPHITVTTRTEIHEGDTDGPIVAVGEASCNSWEKKYRYRNSERVCPACGKAAIIKGKAEYGGGWLCWKKKDGCGATFADNEPAIVSQQSGQVETADPYDVLNTLVKMAEKRADVNATIKAIAGSDLFTQDIEDSMPHQPGEIPPEQAKAEEEAERRRKAEASKAEEVNQLYLNELTSGLDKCAGSAESTTYFLEACWAKCPPAAKERAKILLGEYQTKHNLKWVGKKLEKQVSIEESAKVWQERFIRSENVEEWQAVWNESDPLPEPLRSIVHKNAMDFAPERGIRKDYAGVWEVVKEAQPV